uniref:NACHT domain-containing protein n=1 Tax=Candidatus Kentrum sp. SD TaxID=2126332 RepID=A0A450YL97_9GAMM|nr:MAG: NACHT domain-containing protein [Candidatus Kentron sp. SD]VFK42312.1 MAG: NACHT domain-containing protein [Candidatus Kentron sp. SD]
MTFDFSQNEYQSLSKLIQREPKAIIPFVGAGLSLYGAPDARLPLWGELIDKLATTAVERGLMNSSDMERITHDRSQGRVIAATDYVIRSLGLPGFRQRVEELLDIEDKKIPPAIQRLVSIKWSLIITTNLDQFIERAWLNKHRAPLTVITHADRTQLMRVAAPGFGINQNTAGILAKIHGTVERPETWVFDSNAYRNLAGDGTSSYAEALRTLLLKNILFLGYGLSDFDIDIFIDQIITMFPFGVGSAFAVIPNTNSKNNKLLGIIRDYGIRPIWYCIDSTKFNEPDAGHGQVVEFLSQLVLDWYEIQGKLESDWQGFSAPIPDSVGRQQEAERLIEKVASSSIMGIQIVGPPGSGKTTFVRNTLADNSASVAEAGYQGIFAHSFNLLNESIFINGFYKFLFSVDGDELDNGRKLQHICRKIINRKYIVILDGLEELLRNDGQLESPIISHILMAASAGMSFVICTSRRPLKYPTLKFFDLSNLNTDNVQSLLRQRNHYEASNLVIKQISDSIGSNPLAVEMASGLLDPAHFNAYTRQKVVETTLGTFSSQHGDSLLYDLLGAMVDGLSLHENTLLKIIGIFPGSIPLGQLYTMVGSPSDAGGLFVKLGEKDLWESARELLRKRLIQSENGSKLAMHPLVREFIRGRTTNAEAENIHKAAISYLELLAGPKDPETFWDAKIFFDICYHAAKSGDWIYFDKVFFYRLNRKHKNYLGNVIGSWEDYLYLATLTLYQAGHLTESKPVMRAPYYYSCIARALKHLGRTEESKDFYRKCLRASIAEKHDETARYTNNFLSLMIISGNLSYAQQLVPVNFGTLQWIPQTWRRCWQEEYACNSVGYLYGMLGFIDKGLEFCEYGRNTWKRYGEPKRELFDYYQVYFSELLLANDGKFWSEALPIAEDAIAKGRRNGWKETEATALRTLAAINRCRSTAMYELQYLDNAERLLEQASNVISKISLPRTEAGILLEYLRTVVYRMVFFNIDVIEWHKFSEVLSRLKIIIEQSNFELLRPEYLAAKGWSALQTGNRSNAERFIHEAFRLCNENGSRLFAESSYYLVGALAQRLAVKPIWHPINLQLPTPSKLVELSYEEENIQVAIANSFS